jgi:MSHA pilin protein MshD
MTAASADPQVRKQILAIAESLMEEIQLMPFTYCDPDDANAATAANEAGCAVAANNENGVAIGPEAGEDRYGTTAQFDNVNDYNGFAMAGGIQDFNNNTISGLGAYSASVSVTKETLGSGANQISAASGEVLRIAITVSHPASGTSITLEGYRSRYAPNTLP